MIGTTKGFDELYENNLSVVSEKRLYLQENDAIVNETPTDGLSHVKVLFTPKSRSVCSVEVRGSWTEWKEGTNLKQYSINFNFYHFFI